MLCRLRCLADQTFLLYIDQQRTKGRAAYYYAPSIAGGCSHFGQMLVPPSWQALTCGSPLVLHKYGGTLDEPTTSTCQLLPCGLQRPLTLSPTPDLLHLLHLHDLGMMSTTNMTINASILDDFDFSTPVKKTSSATASDPTGLGAWEEVEGAEAMARSFVLEMRRRA